jgi:EpsI family protein
MRPSARTAVSAILLLLAFLIIHFRSVGEGVPVRASFDSFPHRLGIWTGQDDTTLDPDVLKVLQVSDYVMRRYADPAGHVAWLYVGYWESRRKGADIHSPKNCLPGGGWDPVEATVLTIPVAGARAPIKVNRYLIQKDRQMQLVIYWFQAQGRVISGELEAKLDLMRAAMLKNRTDGALVRISSPVSGTPQETTDRLIQYVQVLYPVLHEYLPD